MPSPPLAMSLVRSKLAVEIFLTEPYCVPSLITHTSYPVAPVTAVHEIVFPLHAKPVTVPIEPGICVLSQ